MSLISKSALAMSFLVVTPMAFADVGVDGPRDGLLDRGPDVVDIDIVDRDVLVPDVYGPDAVDLDIVDADLIGPDVIGPDAVDLDVIDLELINRADDVVDAEDFEVQWALEAERSGPVIVEYGLPLAFALPYEVDYYSSEEIRMEMTLQAVYDLPGLFNDSINMVSLEPADGTYGFAIDPSSYSLGLNAYTFNLLACDGEECDADTLTIYVRVVRPQ